MPVDSVGFEQGDETGIFGPQAGEFVRILGHDEHASVGLIRGSIFADRATNDVKYEPGGPSVIAGEGNEQGAGSKL